jgi:hypothetical protein
MPVLYYNDDNQARGACDYCDDGSTHYQEDAVDVRNIDHYEYRYVCDTCYENEPWGDRDDDECDGGEQERYSFDSDHNIAKSRPRLTLPLLARRDARIISIEQEVGSGGHLLAQRFHDAGLSRSNSMLGYHASDHSTSARRSFCHVENDSTVDGEIVYSMLDMTSPATAQKLESALNIVREEIKDGRCSLDSRCGLHIHVDARGYTMENVVSLYNLWNSLEDTIYRLAAANWARHRSLSANSYSPPVNKGLKGNRAIANMFMNARGGLNLANFLGAMQNCSCGAVTWGAWEECSCEMRKATVEFRVFNATANLRKIHAYTALSLAMVEAARQTPFTSEQFPAFPWSHTEYVSHRERTEDAIKRIMRLPLTKSEKDDIRYCIERSSLASVVAVPA